jgi:hypothetical protein
MILFLLRKCAPLVAVSMLAACGGGSSSSAGTTSAGTTTGTGTGAGSGGSTGGGSAGTSLATNAKIIFLHHSTGGVIWGGGVSNWISAYNSARSTGYQIAERAFPASSPYGWNNYPYDYWNIWVNHAGPQPYLGESTLEILTPLYNVIVFKHCFPVSGIGPDTGSPNIASENMTTENYKLQYAALKTKLRSFPANRFIVWTGAAKLAVNTNPASAARAKAFFDWVRTVWDEPGDNIFVWDFFDLETDGGMYVNPEHAASATDDHPNYTFAAEVAPLFAQRVVDVLKGSADSPDTAHVPGSGDELSLALVGANPASGPVRLRLDLPVAMRVELSLYDAAGRRVALLADGEFPAGTLERTWDNHAAGVTSGIYFARLKAAGRELSRRIVILD